VFTQKIRVNLGEVGGEEGETREKEEKKKTKQQDKLMQSIRTVVLLPLPLLP
jgi:hypothetical protein